MAFCINCGQKLPDEAKFCSSCGTITQSAERKDDIKGNSLDVDVSIQVTLKGTPQESTAIKVWLAHQNKAVEVNVPNSITVGQTLRLQGMGHSSYDGTKGDTYVHIAHIDYENEQQESNHSHRKIAYEGEIRKCPNCGETVDAFNLACSFCGHEFRNTKPKNSVFELALKLEEIEAHRLPKKPRSLGEELFGSDQGISLEDETIISLIRHFTIPNTKEDIIEFMILASSNIDMKLYGTEPIRDETGARRAISDAWLAKLEQAYQKAVFAFPNCVELTTIQKIYSEKVNAVTKEKQKKTREKQLDSLEFAFFWLLIIALVIILAIAEK